MMFDLGNLKKNEMILIHGAGGGVRLARACAPAACCARRGCPRTALELCRLLASLDPAADPLHALLHLDYLALRASEPAVVLTLPAALPAHSLPLYPSFAFSTALALRALDLASARRAFMFNLSPNATDCAGNEGLPGPGLGQCHGDASEAALFDRVMAGLNASSAPTKEEQDEEKEEEGRKDGGKEGKKD